MKSWLLFPEHEENELETYFLRGRCLQGLSQVEWPVFHFKEWYINNWNNISLQGIIIKHNLIKTKTLHFCNYNNKKVMMQLIVHTRSQRSILRLIYAFFPMLNTAKASAECPTTRYNLIIAVLFPA